MSWPEHVWRFHCITEDALNWKPEDKRPLGRPNKKWVDELNLNFRRLVNVNPDGIANNIRSDREEQWPVQAEEEEEEEDLIFIPFLYGRLVRFRYS